MPDRRGPLHDLTGIAGLVCCGAAGFLAACATGRVRSGAAAGALCGAATGVVLSSASYVLAYGFVDSVRQYPFEYHDVLTSGATSVRQYLLSDEGRDTVFGTSVGLAPLAGLLAATAGAAVGAASGCLGARRQRSA